MALRLKHKVLVQLSADSDQKKKRYFLEDDSAQETDTSQFQREISGDLSIADAATEALSFGDVQDARGLYLEVSGPANLFLNGSATAIPLIVAAGTTGSAKVLIEATITSVSITNTDGSGTVLTGEYALWGDPLP